MPDGCGLRGWFVFDSDSIGIYILVTGNNSWNARLRRGWVALSLTSLVWGSVGCHSILNGWLDPTVLGNFQESTTLEIRSSLTLEDTPPGIPGATYPVPADRVPKVFEFPISPGDTLAIEIYELRERQMPFQVQAVVSSTGFVNLPVVGRVEAANLTIPEFEDQLRTALVQRRVLLAPEVTVNPIFLQNATYSIFGIGVSAANNAPLRAGTFPIHRPDLNLLEAINQVGGLNEFVTDIYIFREDNPWWLADRPAKKDSPKPQADMAPELDPAKPGPSPSTIPQNRQESTAENAKDAAVRDLMDAVLSQQSRGDATPNDVLKSLQPEPTDPFIWVNDEFVPNPAARKRGIQPAGASTRPRAGVMDSATPAAIWARIAGDTDFRTIRIPAEPLRSGEPEVNIIVRPGDVIRVVSGEIGVYYVMGQVNRVGAFAFNAEPITLKAAIAAAGGLSALAWPDRCTVYRRIGQREQMIQVDLDRVFAGKDPDFLVRRGDIINVGTHPFAPFLLRIRGFTLPNPVTNVGYSFTYARNFADIDSFASQRNPANEPDTFPALFP